MKSSACGILACLFCCSAQAATLALFAEGGDTGLINQVDPVGAVVSDLSSNSLGSVATRRLDSFVSSYRTLETIPSEGSAYWLRVLADQTPSSLTYTSDYLMFTVTNNGAQNLDLGSFSYTTMALGTNSAITAQYRLYYSTDGFDTTPGQINLQSLSTASGWGSSLPVSVDLADLGLSILAGQTMTFRLSLADDSNLNTKAILFQNITLTSIPEPASAVAVLGGLGMLVLLRRRK